MAEQAPIDARTKLILLAMGFLVASGCYGLVRQVHVENKRTCIRTATEYRDYELDWFHHPEPGQTPAQLASRGTEADIWESYYWKIDHC